MSLFLGNLPPHIRHDELERVFGKFGRCNVQLKDGYGFVIYEVPENADRALRALRGKIICGERISLDWSKRQPTPFQRSGRSTRFYDRRNNIRDEGNGFRNRGSQDRRKFAAGMGHPVRNRGGLRLHGVYNNEDYHQEDLQDHEGEQNQNAKEADIGLNRIESDQCGDPVNHAPIDGASGNETVFERYVPDEGYDSQEENHNHRVTGSYGSPVRSSEKSLRVRPGDATWKHQNKLKPQQSCYKCGQVGHLMRNCPEVDAPRRERFDRFEFKRDDEVDIRFRGDGEFNRPKPVKRERTSNGRDPRFVRRRVNDERKFNSEKAKRLVNKSESSLGSEENHRLKLRRESHRKKRIGQMGGKSQRKRKVRRSASSLSDTGSTRSSHSRSTTSSLKSASGTSSHSRSRSVSRSHSRPNLRSASRTSSSKSKGSRTRSRSSSLKSLSITLPPLDAGLNAKVPSPRGGMEKSASPRSMSPEYDAKSESSETRDIVLEQRDESAFPTTPVEVNGEHAGHHDDNDDVNHCLHRVGHEEQRSHMKLADKVGEVSLENLKGKSGVRSQSGLDPTKIPTGSHSRNTLTISSQEMHMVLRHYGLPMQEDDEDKPVGSYFGSARLWPWEMIYYRRLKKGPISTENYARRVEQNREFGIVDKYVRSSSGWYESG
ncbi:hypothetical protein QJS04_geneDACA008550 [Acorus gramineus]|uniref:Uncharacterized protein n=1 Tax=Acorus gramineus TaxID=55184 RepID=A0AAV9AH01_ACOGR|nr:hypothetical protein QJS04_geneDACA008550 [Acorus gramineus]